MTLLAPVGLLMLVPVVVAVAGYVVLQRRRRHHAVRFANLALLASVAPSRPGWRRHVTAGVALAAMVVLAMALAQPVVTREVPREQAVVVVAIDVSLSMEATDVPPSRLVAAKRAAGDFVLDLPETVQVGVVAYGGTVQVVTPPTTDHELAAAAIDRLTTIEGTATGDAVAASLDAILGALDEAGLAPGGGAEGVVTGPTRSTPTVERAPATIVLLSDGASGDGTPIESVAERAASLGVPVTTITYGTPGGTVELDGEVVAVPPEPQSMQRLAAITGGTAFEAGSGAELASVYEDLEAQVGYVTTEQELTLPLVTGGLLLLLVAFAAGLVWSGRVF